MRCKSFHHTVLLPKFGMACAGFIGAILAGGEPGIRTSISSCERSHYGMLGQNRTKSTELKTCKGMPFEIALQVVTIGIVKNSIPSMMILLQYESWRPQP